MKKLGIIIMLLGICIGNAQTKNFIDQPYIDTTAKVDTLVVPDRIYVTIILQEEDSKGKITLESLEKKMEQALKSVGVNTKESLQVSDMSSAFKKYFLKNKDILKSKTFSLLLDGSKMANDAFLSLEMAGISNVYLEKTEYSNMEQLQLELKRKAIVKAKKQAEYLTAPLGQNVGKAIYIMDRNQQFNNYREVVMDEVIELGYTSGDKNFNEPIEIEFDKIRIETTVSVKFVLK